MSVADFLAFLDASGLAKSDAVMRAGSAFRATRQPIDLVIRELGILPELDLVRAMGTFLKLDVLDRIPADTTTEALNNLGTSFALAKAVVPVSTHGARSKLLVADPFDIETQDVVRFCLDFDFDVEIATRSAIESFIRDAGSGSVLGEAIGNDDAAIDVDLQRLQDVARQAPVVKFVSRVIQEAVDQKASDIHIEPEQASLRVRFRRDGLLEEVERASLSLHAGVVSRLKILARLNIAERRLPQDGRLRIAVRGQDVDFRLSVMPSVHGETVVLRILDRETVQLNLSSLGFDVEASTRIRSITARPNGMLLITGPTGSGKTTTLYAILSELNEPSSKIFTVEDPVEYRLAGITQLQVDPSIGLTFASALRSVLRQDPDIALVGEIRDRETAQIAVQAALTGHFVLSTLHTNSAVGAFGRLKDMGIEPYLIEATLRGVIGQRLVRKRCQACHIDDHEVRCTVCGGSGYSGRQTTFEILQMSDDVRTLILQGGGQAELESAARRNGMVPIREHARHLAELGVTTFEEAIRVVDLEG
ncbi:GspE/PulE family protein [Xaviernesmea oryzae]|uniref:GspE/PulE family protein n=1 Tax=Xaviernesmea oryzae TaxID=464029 RepID=UPI001F33F771|nr:GspE/PulE family protein [Xaviernesmea oryzae]